MNPPKLVERPEAMLHITDADLKDRLMLALSSGGYAGETFLPAPQAIGLAVLGTPDRVAQQVDGDKQTDDRNSEDESSPDARPRACRSIV